MLKEIYLCIECVGDAQLKSRIKKEGALSVCFHCDKERKALNVEKLADQVDAVYRAHYRPSETPDVDQYDGDSIKWKLVGESPGDIIAKMMEVDIKIGQKIAEILSERYKDEFDEDGYYNVIGTYEKSPIDTSESSPKHGHPFATK